MENTTKIEINKRSLFIYLEGKDGNEYINTEHIVNFRGNGCLLILNMLNDMPIIFTFNNETDAQKAIDYLLSAINLHPKP